MWCRRLCAKYIVCASLRHVDCLTGLFVLFYFLGAETCAVRWQLAGLQTHCAFFEKAVQLSEAEAARVEALPPPPPPADGAGDKGNDSPVAVPLVVPSNVVQWKELMASEEIQRVFRERQSRLMKVRWNRDHCLPGHHMARKQLLPVVCYACHKSLIIG